MFTHVNPRLLYIKKNLQVCSSCLRDGCKCSHSIIRHIFFFCKWSYFQVVLIVLRPSTPIFDYLPWQITHSFYVFIQSLTTASGSRLFGSVVRASDFYPDRPSSNPTKGGNVFTLYLIPLLRLSCRKMGARLEKDLISPKNGFAS